MLSATALRAAPLRADFEAQVLAEQGRMLAVARRFFRCEADCQDAVQDATLAALRGFDRFAGTAAVSTWLHRITVNACLQTLRRRRCRPTAALPAADLPTPPAPEPSAGLAAGELRAYVEALPAAYRDVLVLRHLDELDTDAAARQLRTTPGAVKTRLHRARQALRERLLRASAN